jgi:hypothetical protein
MYFEHKPSRGLAPASDTYFKDFSLLFVFGGLSLHK